VTFAFYLPLLQYLFIFGLFALTLISGSVSVLFNLLCQVWSFLVLLRKLRFTLLMGQTGLLAFCPGNSYYGFGADCSTRLMLDGLLHEPGGTVGLTP
jgi:hypothetical protein